MVEFDTGDAAFAAGAGPLHNDVDDAARIVDDAAPGEIGARLQRLERDLIEAAARAVRVHVVIEPGCPVLFTRRNENASAPRISPTSKRSEAFYGNEHSTTITTLRTQAYHTLLQGGCGQLFGNSPIWRFDSLGANNGGWHNNPHTAGIRSMTVLGAFFNALSWPLLVPDISAIPHRRRRRGDTKAATTIASNGSFGAICAPTSRTLTVNLARLTVPNVRARWFDIASGAPTTAAGSPFAANQSHDFVTRQFRWSNRPDAAAGIAITGHVP